MKYAVNCTDKYCKNILLASVTNTSQYQQFSDLTHNALNLPKKGLWLSD